MQPLDYLVEQLWSPAVSAGQARVVVNPAPDPEWVDVERYWALPDAAHARILIPRGEPRVTAAALDNYRGLRFPLANAVRAGAGRLARIGLPISAHRVAVQVRASTPSAREALPLPMLARALGVGQVHASIGIRTGDNRKATLALLDDTGAPAGYAKFGWNAVTDEYVDTESRVLARLGRRAGPARAPGVAADMDYHGHPVVVTEPLPRGVRGAMNRIAPPTSQEIFFLTPVHRHASPAQTAQVARLTEAISAHRADALTAPVADPAQRLLARVRGHHETLPVTARWHGDLTPWNRAREPDGQLWIWDWESSEDDAVAGLDPLHWAFSVRRLDGAHLRPGALRECVAEAAPHLLAAGIGRRDWSVVAAVYVLVVLERACALAAHHRDWSSVWIGPAELTGLLGSAEALLAESGHQPSGAPRKRSSSALAGA